MDLSEKTPLSVLDVKVIDYHLCHAFLFRGTLDVKAMERSLEGITKTFPEIAGRLVKESGQYFFQKNGAGIKFDVEYVNDSILNVDQDNLYLYGAPVSKMAVNQDESIFNVRVTQFFDGAILCVNRSHALCDGNGLFGLLSRWARLCRGDSPLEPMNFDRAGFMGLLGGDQSEGGSVCPKGAVERPADKNVFYVKRKIFADISEFEQLKEVSAKYVGGYWISTRDLIVAKLLKVLSKTKSPGEVVRVESVNNLRNKDGVHPNYFGNAFSVAREKYLVDDLRRSDLLAVAIRYRAVSNYHRFARMARGVLPGCLWEKVDAELLVNDLSKFPLHELDFGMGAPYYYEPGPADRESKFYGPASVSTIRNIFQILPAASDKKIPINIFLDENEMELFLEEIEEGAFFKVAV